MSDTRSTSSYALSAIEFNSKSLNPLDSMNPAVVNKIKRQADGYANCASRCAALWTALSKNDIAGSNLTEKVLQIVFGAFQSDLYAFTRIGSLKEFMKIFDQDKDGSLNPDEQIQIFCFIKERLELTANNCLQIQAYVKFDNLMKEVRKLESNIAEWQEQLRSRVHKSQLDQYHQEGSNRLDEFCDKYDREFSQLQELLVERRATFERSAYYQSQQLEEKLGQSSEYLKIKPKNKIKELQVQQKLVSLEERVYEALDFRRELNELEVKERDRVDKLMKEHAQHQRDNLARKHTMQRKQLEFKLQQMENKQIIKMKKEFDILKKKNGLYEIEIKRLQGLEKTWAYKKGLFEPELRRTKKLEKQRNEVLEEYKKSLFGSTTHSALDVDQDSGTAKTSKFNARSLLENTTKFRLTHRMESQMPINSKAIKSGANTSGSKITKFLMPKENEKSYSLCKLYDNKLDELQIPPLISEQIKHEQKMRKFNFIMEKMTK